MTFRHTSKVSMILFKTFVLMIMAPMWPSLSWQAMTRNSPTRVLPLFLGPQQLGSFETLDDKIAQPASSRKVLWYDLSSETPINFEAAWRFQKELLDDQVQRIGYNTDDDTNSFLQDDECDHAHNKEGVDTVIMLQHEPVFTLGTGSDDRFVLSETSSVPVVRMDRGGEVTYHGPGQLTVYPIFDLRNYQQDIHWYMRALEEAILLALEEYGLERAERQDDVTGVWVDNYKVAAVGIKCRRWVTQHGLAVNVEMSSLENFDQIVPCGLEGRQVGCLNQFLEKPITVAEFAETMKYALESVFRVQLTRAEQSKTNELRENLAIGHSMSSEKT